MKIVLGSAISPQHTFLEVRSAPQEPAPVLSPRLQPLGRVRTTEKCR
jgi:hypothetical protein